MSLYREYDGIDFPAFEKEVLEFWNRHGIFQKSIETRQGAKEWVFYEGPPSANGMPGIHHVMARAIKDIFCRYKTLKGFKVERKGGWDTHGLPIELQVEKSLGISKDDIGKTISVEDYNRACKKDVLKFKDVWDNLTQIMGYWVDLENPYITYEKDYIETLWYLLKQLYEKDLLYKGYTIQPYSPAAGTGLSSHELNQPGTYRDVKDTTIVAQFKAVVSEKLQELFGDKEIHFLAWTTTPWTLPSNTALAVGEKVEYALVSTFNQYTGKSIHVVLAKDLIGKYFSAEGAEADLVYEAGQKLLPYRILKTFKGKELEGLKYEQLLPYAQPEGDAFRVILGDFVTTEDGTGIVHIAPTFGADDMRVAKQAGIAPMLVKDDKGKAVPLVDLQGRFRPEMQDETYGFAGEYVKEDYLAEDEKEAERQKQGRDKYLSVDERLSIKLKQENKAFKVEKYEHNYPHCWRTDKPLLYYPLESWFIKTTAVKDRLIALNNTINWKPKSTGTGRFGNWLENLVDWNLSRSRYWGTPLPIWRTKEGEATKCIGSVEELFAEIEKAKASGIKQSKNFDITDIDLHKPYVDEIVLVSDAGEPMYREPDLIDVWFDSGAMPYAQWHYPFDRKSLEGVFPADFIAEGVDQTRGWFFTLHAISVMLFDSVAYKNVVANGLVLDKNGNKMSKRLGNAVDPFTTIEQFGADAVRWYMLSNAAPWDNLKFDIEGVKETQRKFFGTLYNVYGFFALYANIDKFDYSGKDIPKEDRPEIDRWILSLLNSLVISVEQSMDDYEPSKATRAIQNFVTENLSNWYVRLCRRRFWKGELNDDKISAYQTLYTCLETVSKLMSPFAPFYADKLYKDLTSVSKKENHESVHLGIFPSVDTSLIDSDLEERMQMAQDISSLVLSIRKKMNIRVRQPLQRVLIPAKNEEISNRIQNVKDIILSEVNVKSLEFLTEDKLKLERKIKANFRILGKKVGKLMKAVSAKIEQLNDSEIAQYEKTGSLEIEVENQNILLEPGDLEISFDDIPGWQVASDGNILVALDVNIDDELKKEGLARELVNRVQNLRKEQEFNVTDHIHLSVSGAEQFRNAFLSYKDYICAEILAHEIEFVDNQNINNEFVELEIENQIFKVSLNKVN